MGDKEFKSRFRMCPDTFTALVGAIQPTYREHHQTTRGRSPFPIELYTAVCISYLATPDSMLSIADKVHLGESTVGEWVGEFVDKIIPQALAGIISFPEPGSAGRQAIAKEFQEASETPTFPGFLNLVGAVDGTYIDIRGCFYGDQSYINRKQDSAIVLMAVADYRLRFLDVAVGFPGCYHDARSLLFMDCYRRSSEIFADGVCFTYKNILPLTIVSIAILLQTYICGDSAFPSLSWLVPVFKSARGLKEQFNARLSAVRVCVERAFGRLKEQWRRLKMMHCGSLERANNIVYAACALQNFLIDHGEVCETQWKDPNPTINDALELALDYGPQVQQEKRSTVMQTGKNNAR